MLAVGSDYAAAVAGTSKVIPLPVGRANGDVCFLQVNVNTSGAPATATIAAIAGWTLLATDSVASLGGFTLLKSTLFYRVLDGTEGGTVTATWTASTLIAMTGVTSCHRGVNVAAGTFDVAVTHGTHTGSGLTGADVSYATTAQPVSRVLVFAATDSIFVPAFGSASTTVSFYDQTSEFRSMYAVTADPPTALCRFLDQTLPGSGTVNVSIPGIASSVLWVWFTLSLRSLDTTSSPGADSILGLVTQAPPRAVGQLADPTGGADWAPRLSVQVASPNASDGAYWDVSFWDVDGWGAAYEWVDVSDRTRGLHWERGAQSPGARPEVGTATLTLQNIDGAVSPWATTGAFTAGGATYLKAGLLVRFGVTVFHGGIYEYLPFFTGTVESFDEGTEHNADGWVTITAVETAADLAGSNDVAVSPVGAGDTLAQRIARLLLAADWPYGSAVSGGVAGTLQATTMADDKLTEIYKSADSLYARVVSGSGGKLAVSSQDPVSGTPAVTFSNDPAGAELPLEDVQPYASTDRLLNRAVGARTGGTQQQSDDIVSQGAFGVFASGYGFPRDDLICSDDATVLLVLAAVVADHADDDLGLSSVTLNADMDKVNLYRVLSQYAALGVEFRQPLTVRWVHPSGASLTIDLRVDGFAFDIMGLGPTVRLVRAATITTSKDA